MDRVIRDLTNGKAITVGINAIPCKAVLLLDPVFVSVS